MTGATNDLFSLLADQRNAALVDAWRASIENSRLRSLLKRTLAAIGELGPTHTTTDLESVAEEIRAELGRQEEGCENS